MEKTSSISSIADLRDEIKERLMFRRFAKTILPIIGMAGIVCCVSDRLILLAPSIVFVILVVSIMLIVFAPEIPDKTASKIAKRFYLGRKRIAIEFFLKDLKIINIPDDFLKNINNCMENISFASFSFGDLELSFSFLVDECNTLKRENGMEIIVDKFKLIEKNIDGKDVDMFVITYKQYKPEGETKGKEYQNMEYSIQV